MKSSDVRRKIEVPTRRILHEVDARLLESDVKAMRKLSDRSARSMSVGRDPRVGLKLDVSVSLCRRQCVVRNEELGLRRRQAVSSVEKTSFGSARVDVVREMAISTIPCFRSSGFVCEDGGPFGELSA